MNDKRIIRLLDKVSAFLDDGEWQKADEFCDKVIESVPENAEAYLGKLMAEYEVKNRDELKNCAKPLEDSECYDKIISYGDEELVELVKSANESIKTALEEKRKKQAAIKKALKIGIPAVVAAAVIAVVLIVFVIPAAKKSSMYKDAVALMQAGEAQSAMCTFKELGDYKDSAELLKKLRSEFAPKETISSGNDHVAALKSDGKVISVYSDGKSHTDGWNDIVAVSSGMYHSVGLKANGTVVAVGNNDYGQCDVSGWTDIIAVSAGGYHTVGLKSDGTVVAVGFSGDARCNVGSWTDIVAVSAGGSHTVGLKADGTVVAVGEYTYNQLDVTGWKNIVSISAGGSHTAALTADGKVVVTDSSEKGFVAQKRAEEWEDIVAVSAGYNFTVGLKADGTAVAVGANRDYHISVDDWKDIVAVSAGSYFAVGLTKNGTVVSTAGHAYYSEHSQWSGIKLPTK